MVNTTQLNFGSEVLNVNLYFCVDIPSPTRKKGSTSTSEDCVVPDIDDEDNVFNFEQPRVPAGMYCTCIIYSLCTERHSFSHRR